MQCSGSLPRPVDLETPVFMLNLSRLEYLLDYWLYFPRYYLGISSMTQMSHLIQVTSHLSVTPSEFVFSHAGDDSSYWLMFRNSNAYARGGYPRVWRSYQR
jgi:hypothetical protein